MRNDVGGMGAVRAVSAHPMPAPRITLRDDLRDSEGEPRPCVTWPGRTLPVAFPTLSAALAAIRDTKGGAHG